MYSESGSGKKYIYQRDILDVGINTAFEYGISDTGDAIYQTLVYHAIDTDSNGMTSAGGITYSSALASDFFIRKRLWQHRGMVISVQPKLKLVAFDHISSSVHSMNSTASEVAIRLLAGKSIYYKEKYHFMGVEAGLNRRSAAVNEVHVDSTLGVRPYRNWLLLSQNFTTVTLGKVEDDDAGTLNTT